MVTTPAWLRISWEWIGEGCYKARALVIEYFCRTYIELHGRPSTPAFLPYYEDNQLTWTTTSYYRVKMYCLLYRMVSTVSTMH